VPVAPWTGIPSGNPPSAIVGGYCIIDASVLATMQAFSVVRLHAPALARQLFPAPSGA
jgi:hypothetical protein